MKSSKLNDYLKMDKVALENEINNLKKELFSARFSLSTNSLDNPKKLQMIKKNIARAKTVLSSLESK